MKKEKNGKSRLFTLMIEESLETEMNKRVIERSSKVGKLMSVSSYIRDLIKEDCNNK